MLTRREFSKGLLGSGAALIASEDVWPAAKLQTDGVGHSNQRCDLLVKGGTVIDPGQQLNGLMDVAVKDGKILGISPNFPENQAQKVISAKGRIVTPGFIDMHVHCFEGFGGMNADRYCLGKGVTTVVDCGSTGYLGFDALVKFVVKSSTTRIYPLLNIGALGLIAGGSVKKSSDEVSKGFQNVMENPDWVYPQQTIKTAEENKGSVFGIKVRLQENIQGPRDLENLKMALQAAEATQLPIMAHIDTPHSPLQDILKMMRKGDVFTHVFNGHVHGILDENGKILPEVLEARERGVIMDPAHGGSHFSFDTAEKAMQQGFLPDTISTDLNDAAAQTFDLPTLVSEFMTLGMDIDKAIERVTIKPAQVFNYGVKIGTLRPGYEADISIFELQDIQHEFHDSDKKSRTGHQMLVNKGVVCRGQFFANET